MNKTSSMLHMLSLMTVMNLSAFAGSQPAKDQPAEKVYKNIQVLKGIKASQLVPTMLFIRNSLGVECSFCHVSQPTFLPELDQKPEKLTARKMMLMMRQINEQNFNGETWVTCATCHQGHMRPAKTPPLLEAVAHTAAPELIEQVTEPTNAASIFAKYENAIGGEAAIAKLTTRVAIATVSGTAGNMLDQDIYQVAPNKILSEVRQSDVVTDSYAYDGSVGWTINNWGKRELDISNPDTQNVILAADFWRDLKLAKQYENTIVSGKTRVDGHEAYIVHGWLTDGLFSDVLYFDVESGLLLRRVTNEHTPLGDLPEQQDFSDYREVQGIKVPFTVRQSTPSSIETRTYTKIVFNVHVDPAIFEKPRTPVSLNP